MLRRNTNSIILAIILDLFSIGIAIIAANWLRLNLPFGRPLRAEPGIETLLLEAVVLFPVIFLLLSLYDPRRAMRFRGEFQQLFWACTLAYLALAGMVYFTAREISRLFLLYFFAMHFLSVVNWRITWRLVRRAQNENGSDQRRVLLIGGGESANQALERLKELAWAGVHLVGYLTDGETIPTRNGPIPHLGTLKNVEEVVRRNKVDDVLIALPAENYDRVRKLLPKLMDHPSNIWVVPDYFNLLIYGGQVDDLGGVPMISLKAPTLAGYQRVVKRAFDLLVGIPIMIPALPLMGVIAVAIKLDSPGPAIFKQQRVGENGRLFFMYKFRSMIEGADRHLPKVMKRDRNGDWVHKRPDDPRVTRVGQFIRRTSLDELPQLFNVLKGEMSLVGPRPEMPVLVEKYQPWQMQRFAVPQGITGWWQINGRSDKPMHLHTEDDIYYVQNYSLLLDIQILAKTIGVVLRRKGAY
ncbi:MAG: sugar transferase [Anaerolineales bacterium]|nr:sugar transferase [Anaerolineales bacterium]